jgi:hypothetical protein
MKDGTDKCFHSPPTALFCLIADWSGHPVIFSPTEGVGSDFCLVLTKDAETMRAPEALRIVTANGWRVLEQRFPRRAYVVIRGEREFNALRFYREQMTAPEFKIIWEKRQVPHDQRRRWSTARAGSW